MILQNDYYKKKIVLWIFIIISHISKIFPTRGCITILKDSNTKRCICTNYESGFTRIPDKIPYKVAELTIENQKITTLDSSQLRNLHHLSNFTFNNNKLSRIVPNSFSYVQNLISLRLSGNNLFLKESSLPRGSFIHLKRLRILDLSKNPIGFVPDYYFQSLKQLNVLILSGARKGFFIEENGFYGLPSLKSLDLSFTHLTTLPETLLHSFSTMQLQEFYLYKNPWNCDCNLQWLKMWFTKHKTIKFSKSQRKDATMGNNLELLADIQPKCSDPPTVKGKNLLTNSLESASIGIMDFKCPPMIFTKDRKIEVSMGKNVTLTCDLHANPGGNVVWSKNGLIVQKHWPRVSWSTSQGIKFKAWLNIFDVEESDSGNWRCILTTTVGKVNATFFLKVLSEPSNLDFKYIMKYVGIGAVTIILLLVVIGIIIYCIYGFQIQNNRQRKTANVNKFNLNNNTDTNYHIMSRGSFSPIHDSPHFNRQYCNSILLGDSSSAVKSSAEDSHSPFSHYLMNGSATVCPLHGEITKKPPIEVDENGNCKQSVRMSHIDGHVPHNNQNVPCPIHGDVLSYLAPTSSSNIQSPATDLNCPIYSKTPAEYVVRASSCNPTSIMTPDSYLEDMKYLSSDPDLAPFSFSAAI